MSKDYKLEIVWMSPKELIPYANNAKVHSDEEINGVLSSILKFGFDQPIAVDKDKVIIKGHKRTAAALKGGLERVPVVVRSDLNEYEVMAARLADNALQGQTYDRDKLKFELGTLQRVDFDLKSTGYSLGEIERFTLEKSESANTEKREPTTNTEESQEPPESNQFIVTVHCKDEDEMKSIYDEMIERGMECKLIT